MFLRDKSLSRLNVTGEIVDLYRSINRARVAPEGAELQPCDACVITMKTGDGVPSVYVVLFLTVNRVRQVFTPEQQPTTMFEYERALQEAMDFAESIGFMLDSVEVDSDPQRSAEIVNSIPALYIPGIDPPPGISTDLTLQFTSGAPFTPTNPDPSVTQPDVAKEASPPASPSRPSDLLARLRSLVQAEPLSSALPETRFDDEIAGELILDDLTFFESDTEASPSTEESALPTESGDSSSDAPLESFEGIGLFDDYAPLDAFDLNLDAAAGELPRMQESAGEGARADDAPVEAPVELAVPQFAPEADPGGPTDTAVEHVEDDDDLLIAGFGDFDGRIGVAETSPGGGLPEERCASESIVAEVVSDERPAVPHTTDLSRLAAGSILEQIGKLLGSL